MLKIESVLLVEDDKFKQELVTAEIRHHAPSASMVLASSVQQAVRLIRSSRFDLVILDMSLPSYQVKPGGAQPISQPTGGVEILLELGYENRDDAVLILTQFPEIEFDGDNIPLENAQSRIGQSVNANIVQAVYFNAQNSEWRVKLRDFIS